MGLLHVHGHLAQRFMTSGNPSVTKLPLFCGVEGSSAPHRPVTILQNAGTKGQRPAERSPEYLVVGNLETSTPEHPTAIALPLGHGVAVAYRDQNPQGPVQAVQTFKNAKAPMHFVLSPAPEQDLRPHARTAKSILNLLA